MMDKLSIPLPQLSKDSYQRWRFDVLATLESHGLLEITIGTEAKSAKADKKERKNDDAKARRIFSCGLDNEMHAHVRACKTYEMWKAITSLMEASSATNVLLNQEYSALKFRPESTVGSYCAELLVICEKLKHAGQDVTKEMRIAKLITDLPEKFATMKSMYRFEMATGKLASVAFTDVQGQLQLLKREMGSTESDQTPKVESNMEALVAQGKFRQKKPFKGRKPFQDKQKETRECFYCGNAGHLNVSCEKRKRDKEQQMRASCAFEITRSCRLQEA